MADRVRKVNYCYIVVPARAGSGAKALEALKEAGINMLAFSGFPVGGGKAQLDFVVEDSAKARRTLTKGGWKASAAKKGFLVQGKDRAGAVGAHMRRLADAGVSVTAADAVTGDQGRYAMILWVKPKDYSRAAKTLRAR